MLPLVGLILLPCIPIGFDTLALLIVIVLDAITLVIPIGIDALAVLIRIELHTLCPAYSYWILSTCHT